LIARLGNANLKCFGKMPEHFSFSLETLGGIAELEPLY